MRAPGPGLAALVACGGLLSGCYISSPPTNPHGNAALDPAKLSLLAVPEPVSVRSARLLVMGRFDSQATQPIGGLYDQNDYSISPLYRTYFFRDGVLEVFENTCDALRATGLEVRKDYGSVGEPALVEPRLAARNPLLITGVVGALQHDQVRTGDDGAHDFEVARLAIKVVVRDLQGQTRYAREHVIEGRVPAAPESNLLRTLGLRLGDLLTHDREFLRAVEAS